MPDRDILARLRLAYGDIRAALGLLTRLPIQLSQAELARGASAAWAYPLAGLVVGGIASGLGSLAGWFGLPAAFVAGLALAAMILVTGALHEDGLADTADGFWGGWEPARRLEIMKDSHIGSYGVIALILSLGLRWVALSSLVASGSLWAALLLSAAVSRAPMVVLMAALPHARQGGLSVRVGRPDRAFSALAAGLALLIGLVFLGGGVIWLLVVLGISTLGLGLIASAKIKGQTGDVLGATQQVSEILVLALCLVVLL